MRRRVSSSAPSVSERLAARFRESILRHVRYSLAGDWQSLDARERLHAVSLAVRDRLIEGLLETEQRVEEQDAKRLYYFSMEFLMGRSLANNVYNLGLHPLVEKALGELGVSVSSLEETEPDAALGNGGLGRLAACFLDSLATLGMPGYGYGINYEFGLFRQEIDSGCQKEKPDNWRALGTPWLIERPAEACVIPIYGHIEHLVDRNGGYNPMWLDWRALIGVPHDMPIVGYGGRTVNYLRLYSARASHDFDMQIFNNGDYFKAVEQKMSSETVSKVLYPSDSFDAGRELRLIQEYFFVACALRDIMRRYCRKHSDVTAFPAKIAIQLNDTHPALAVAELMRILVDEKDLQWEQAWEITQATLGYTNHTLLPEALEKWPVRMFETILPRHLQIIYEINRRFLQLVEARWPSDHKRLRRMSIVEEGRVKQVRMAHLAIAGSHSVNGVAALHSELVKSQLVPDFHQLWPERFNNKTNGVTQRRWLLKANPLLADLLSKAIGDAWVTDLHHLQRLIPLSDDRVFQDQFHQVKRMNKKRLAATVWDTLRINISPDSLFDVQIKRIHEYKRQLLNVLHIIHRYLVIADDGIVPAVPRTFVFAGKAAPGYWAAKQIIRLINAVGSVINQDPKTRDLLRVVFLPDYRVSLAEIIIPAADLSEQISTAGKEASGTSNMKFAMNGALTIGTLDGANIEILEEVGSTNIFIFGLKSEEVSDLRQSGTYDPQEYCERYPHMKRVMETLFSGRFSPGEPELFRQIHDALMTRNEGYFHLADFPSYIETQDRVDLEYQKRRGWIRKSILNVARVGKFSSDRTIQEYARDTWDLKAV